MEEYKNISDKRADNETRSQGVLGMNMVVTEKTAYVNLHK